MGRPSTFTDADIRTIGVMRAQGKSWRAIEARLGRPHQNIRRVWVECLRQPGGWARSRGAPPPPLMRTPCSPPLPVGHWIPWVAITEGALPPTGENPRNAFPGQLSW